MRNYTTFVESKKEQYSDTFSEENINKDFIPYFNSQEKVKVEYTYKSGVKETYTGTIGITTGWKPCFLLMRTERSRGSSYTISDICKVIAVKKGSKYIAI